MPSESRSLRDPSRQHLTSGWAIVNSLLEFCLPFWLVVTLLTVASMFVCIRRMVSPGVRSFRVPERLKQDGRISFPYYHININAKVFECVSVCVGVFLLHFHAVCYNDLSFC